MKNTLKFFKNKYAIATIFFLVLITFFDRYDLISQVSLRQQVSKLREEKKYYKEEITKNNLELNSLQTNPENLEKFAREKYLMKKDNEDVFVLVNDTVK